MLKPKTMTLPWLQKGLQREMSDLLEGNITYDQYTDYLKKSQEQFPGLFGMLQRENTEAQIAYLNELDFADPIIPGIDKQLMDVARMNVSIPYGSEAKEYVGSGRVKAGGVTILDEDRNPLKAYKGGTRRLNTALHEALHMIAPNFDKALKDKSRYNDKPIGTEQLARAFDATRAFLSGDETLAEDTKSFARKRNMGNPTNLVRVAITALPQLYNQGLLQFPEESRDQIEAALAKVDEDEKGIIDWILNERPKAQRVGISYLDMKPEEYNRETIAQMLELAPLLVPQQQDQNESQQYFDINRTGFEDTTASDL